MSAKNVKDPELVRYAQLSEIFEEMADDAERLRALTWVNNRFGNAHQIAQNGSGQPISHRVDSDARQ